MKVIIAAIIIWIKKLFMINYWIFIKFCEEHFVHCLNFNEHFMEIIIFKLY